MKKLNQKSNIVLTGMPGAGKSTAGQILAKELNRPFVDTDSLIQSGEEKRLQEIISQSGMKHFLAIEEKYVMGLQSNSSIISTGGSVIYSAPAMNKLALSGIIIYLNLDLTEIKKRFSCMDKRGVARAPGQTIESLYRERLPLYKNYADLTIDCNSLQPEEVTKRILLAINSLHQQEK